MLEPLNRRQLFDALRPPQDYDVDVAIGTTFSLDLMTLLGVPLAFALFDWEDDQGRINPDPTALLEAGRRYAGRTHLFCQEGRIYLPSQRSPLLFQLESVIHEVRPPQEQGVFHPKVWILRFVPRTEDQPERYRLLCSSRNLTFDRSWDTLLVLEGELTDRELPIANNHPLGDFVRALPAMMTTPPSDDLRKMIARVHQELRRVRFKVPEGFDEVQFQVLGLPDSEGWWFDPHPSQVLAVAPFVDWTFLNRLTNSNPLSCTLISRLEQLQELKPSLLKDCRKVYYLDPSADEPMPDEDEGEESSVATTATDAARVDEELSGLHAKLYIADYGWNSSVWTGSANATEAALSRNIEFLVRLTGKKSVCGVDAFLARTKGQTCFADMLQEFNSDKEPKAVDEDIRRAEKMADRARQAIARLGLAAIVTHLDGESYDVEVASEQGIQKASKKLQIELTCWPVTVQERNGHPAEGLLNGGRLRFSQLSFESLTSFFAFHVKATVGKSSHEVRFVLNLPVKGMPPDRSERMLRVILHNRSQIWRMLFLLLANSSSDILMSFAKVIPRGPGDETQEGFSSLGELALLEPLLKTLEQNPKSLERVARLVDDLCKTEGGSDLFPPGFLQVWAPIWQVAQQVNDEKPRR